MKKKILFSVLVVSAALFILWTMLYQAGTVGGPVKVAPGEKTKQPAENNTWTELKEEVVPVMYTAVGTVRSRESVDIISRLQAARILEIKVRSGDSVKAGDLLVRLESKDLQSELERVSESLNGAKSRLKFAENEFKRNEKLLESNAVSRRAYEEALNQFTVARAEVSMFAHALESAKINLSYAELRAPFDGIVAERFNDPGDMATPQKPVLTFFDPSKLVLRIPVREGLVSRLKPGAKFEVRFEALSRTLAAEIREVIPSVDPGSRTFSVDACLVGDTSAIMPGMFAVCGIGIGDETVLTVPAKAVRRVGQLQYLTVKTASGPVDQYISSVPYGNGRVKIISGLKAGDFYAEDSGAGRL